MPAIRSAPPLGSVAAPMSSDLPAHATPDIYPASPFAPDLEPATSVHTAPDEDQVPSALVAQGAYLGAPVALASLEVATDTPVSATTPDGEPAISAPAAPEVDSAAQAPGTEPTTSAPASSEADAAAAPEGDPGASPVTHDGESAMSAPAAPEVDQTEAPAASDVEPAISGPTSSEADAASAAAKVDPAAQGLANPDAEPAISAPASSEADAVPTLESAPDASPVAFVGESATPVHAAPGVDAAAQAPTVPDIEPATPESVSSELHAAPTPEVDPGTPRPIALDGEPAPLVYVVPEVDPAAQAPAASDAEPATSVPASSEGHAMLATPEVDPGAPLADLDSEPATWVHVVPEVDPAAQAPAASDVDQAASARSPFQTRPAPSAPPASDLDRTVAPGLGNVRSTPAPAPSGGAPRVEISHDGPSQRIVPPAPVPPVNPALAWPSERPEPVDLSLFSAALTTETGDKSQIPADVPAEKHAETPEVEAEEAVEVEDADEARAQEVVHEAVAAPQVPVVRAVAGPEPPAVLSIERALSGPSKDRNLTWHGKVKIVAGIGQGPGKRDQEALDRARARLPLKTPRRVLMLGCTSGAGQSVTTLMTGHILASLRDEPVAAVDLHDGTLARYSAPAGWLEDMLSGRPPQGATKARPDGLGPTLKNVPARLDVIASHGPLGDGDELKLAAQLTRHYLLTMLDPGAAGLMKLLKIADQLVIVVPASIDGAGALADTRDWLDTHGFADLADHSVTVINGVSRRSLADVEDAESVARGRCRAIVRVPWDDMLPVEIADPSALRPQTRVAYTALAGVLVAGMAAAPVRTSQ